MVFLTVNFLNDFNLFSTELMHSLAFWLYSPKPTASSRFSYHTFLHDISLVDIQKINIRQKQTTKTKHLYFIYLSKFLVASSTPAQIGLLMSHLTILLLCLSLKFFQIFHTRTQLVFRCISFLASGRYYPLHESNRDDLLC